MNFTSNSKKKRHQQKIESAKKKRRISTIKTKQQQTNSERFNFFIDLLNSNKNNERNEKLLVIKENNSNISIIPENKESNFNVNINDPINNNSLKEFNKSITYEDINNTILEDIDNILGDEGNDTQVQNENIDETEREIIIGEYKEDKEDKENKEIRNNHSKKFDDSIEENVDVTSKKYILKKQTMKLKENKIIEHNINLILNKDKSLTGKKKINKREIDIVNQFQLNALGYINYYMKRQKEIITANKRLPKRSNIFNLNSDEIEKLIDQEWLILEKTIKDKTIKNSVNKETKKVKKVLKSKRVSQKNLNKNSNENIPEDNNDSLNHIDNSINNNNSNIPNIPDSEMIKQELKEYTELNLLSEIYNDSKSIPIPHFSVIKHPPNAFSFYTKDNINKITKKNPSLTRNEALKIVARKWKKISKEEKCKYTEKAKEYKDDYENLIKYAYLQRALINNPNIARLILEYQLKNNKVNEFDQENNINDENINFRELENEEEIIKAFQFIVKKFPNGYPLASPLLRFPERGITQRLKKSQNQSVEDLSENELPNKKSEKFNINIKPKIQAFDYFVKDRYKLLLKATPNISLSNLIDELMKEWKYLSYDDKLPYILLEIKDIKRYYKDECEISKERRGKKRKSTYEDDIEAITILEDGTIVNINGNNDNDEYNDIDNNTLNPMEELNDDIQISMNKVTKNLKGIRHTPTKVGTQQNQQKSQYVLNSNENLTLIENSEDEQEYDNNLLYLRKNDIYQEGDSYQRNNKDNTINNIMKKSYESINGMEETNNDSDTSEEYLKFDNNNSYNNNDNNKNFYFEKNNDKELNNSNINNVNNITKVNLYDNFNIESNINYDNINNSKDDTFIPVIETNTNNSLNYSSSEDTIIYNTQEHDINSDDNNHENHNNNDEKNEKKNKNKYNTISVVQSYDELIKNLSLKFLNDRNKSQSLLSNESNTTEFLSPNTLIKNSYANLSQASSSNSIDNSPTPKKKSLNKKKKDSKSNQNYEQSQDQNILPQKAKPNNKELIKPIRPVRRSSSWKFGNDVEINQQITKKKLDFMSDKSKNTKNRKSDDDDDIESESESDSESSSSSEEGEEEEDKIEEEENEENIFISKENNKYNGKNKIKTIKNNLKYKSSNIPKLSSPIKYIINKGGEEESEGENFEEYKEEIEEIEQFDDEKANKENKKKNNHFIEDEIEEIELSNSKYKKNKTHLSIDNNGKSIVNKNSNIIKSNSSSIEDENSKNVFNKFNFENSFVTPKKNKKFKNNYSSSSSKKNNYKGKERKKI